ncbi:hypothetical protein L0337_41955 [candidate division KSB1 bacterium]|nr:hypothetical protein [candidate division KSB1 bacterium]
MLEVLFEKPIAGERAFELSFDIILFVNPHTGKPINLTILDYKRLLKMDKIPLENLKTMPISQQRKIRRLLSSELLSNFLELLNGPRLKKNHVRLLNPEFRQLLAV